MKVTYLGHSGFLAELETVSLLFDWWKGDLPPLPADKPLAVFASHRHGDHFDPKIFSLDGERTRFLLGKGIRLTERNFRRWGLGEAAAARCRVLAGGETAELLPGVTVETLRSTDEGVAFLVTAEGTTIFHAGDLNWWHWEGEDPGWNRNMEADFKRYAEPLRGRRIDLAMLPLDPRLGAVEVLTVNRHKRAPAGAASGALCVIPPPVSARRPSGGRRRRRPGRRTPAAAPGRGSGR